MTYFSVETTEDYFSIEADEYQVGPYGVTFTRDDKMIAFCPHGSLVLVQEHDDAADDGNVLTMVPKIGMVQ